MIDTHRCDDKDVLVAYLYDEIDAAGRRRFEDHLRVCVACAAETGGLAAVRQELADWAPPETELGFTVVPRTAPVLRPARWWSSPLPAWAQAAAAVLVVAAGLSIANLQVRYGADGPLVTTGWMRPSQSASAPPAAAEPAVRTVAVPAAADETWRPALTSLRTELLGAIESARRPAAAPVAASGPRAVDEATMRRIVELIDESERRQKRELALRLTQFGRDIEVQRRTDNRRNVQALGQFEVLSSAELARQRQALDYIMRVSAPPPQ